MGAQLVPDTSADSAAACRLADHVKAWNVTKDIAFCAWCAPTTRCAGAVTGSKLPVQIFLVNFSQSVSIAVETMLENYTRRVKEDAAAHGKGNVANVV